MKILFICTSNSDRSIALAEYFSVNYPNHEYRSAGINKYFTGKKGTHYLTQEDIEWADLVVFAEQIHSFITFNKFTVLHKDRTTLSLGEYKQGNIAEDYLTRAEEHLKRYLII